MKKLFDKVRQWTRKQIPDSHIKQVLDALAENNVYYPSDFVVTLTKEQKDNVNKVNIELNEKTQALFEELDHSEWGNSETASQNIATIIFGLVLSANSDTLEKEVKNKTQIKYDVKGGKADVEFATKIEYPISLKRVEDVKAYLDTKVTHPFPEVMYEDIRHTKKFTDIPWGVLTHLVSYYHAYNGDVTSKDMLGYVKHKMVKEVPLNKRGANINGGNIDDETEVSVTQFNKYFMRKYSYIGHSLSNKEIEKFLNQSYIKEAKLSKKADLFQDYLLANGLADDVQLKDGGKVEEEAKKRVKQRIVENLEKIKQGKYKNGANISGGIDIDARVVVVRGENKNKEGVVIDATTEHDEAPVADIFLVKFDDGTEEDWYPKNWLVLGGQKAKKGSNVGFIKLTKNQKARLDVLQSKEDISDLNEAENKEYEALVKLYRKTKDYKGRKKAKGGYVFKGDKYEFVPYKFEYTIGGL